jgi:hypothetical protein
MFNTIVGAGAASRYGTGSDQKMRLRLRNTGFNIGSTKKKFVMLFTVVQEVSPKT